MPEKISDGLQPELRPLTERQATRLATLSKAEPTSLVGKTVAELGKEFGSISIDPQLLLFRKICGRVVKHDPVTGELIGVPFATVEVEDTDVNLISYFPIDWRWGWYFPFRVHREVIGTTTTDACGNFCVWVPRFDVDYILRWRLQRRCFIDIFKRPNLGDLLPPREIPSVQLPPHGPPDPGPLERLSREQLHTLAGRPGLELSRRLDLGVAARAFGAHVDDLEPELSSRAFVREMAPPLPPEFQKALSGVPDVIDPERGFDGIDAVRSALALKLDLHVDELAGFDPRRFIGPFLRCIDLWTPEWTPILDVPDITFKVSQDVDGDGDLETIYSEGFFDVRWDAGTIPPVTLVASEQAIGSRICQQPDVPCSDVPEISFAGLMPLTSAYVDANGYATRPNKPTVGPPAETPFCEWLALYGCVDIDGASYYRIQRSVDGGPFQPILGLTKLVTDLTTNLPVIETPADGWYLIRRPRDNYFPSTLLLELPPAYQEQDVLKVELADTNRVPLNVESQPVALQIDNSSPTITPSLAWKFVSEPASAFDLPGRDLLVPCATIHRGAAPQDVVVRFQVVASAHRLRDASIGTSGCGTGNTFDLDGTAPSVLSHWHTTNADNTVTLFAQWVLTHDKQEGAYAFTADAVSCAINPAGSDNGHLLDWNYDHVYIHTPTQWNVAVISSNG